MYSSVVTPLSYEADATAVNLSVAVATPQIITGAQLVLPPGRYLLSYSSSQTFTPTVSNISDDFSANTFIYNTTAAADIADTTFLSFTGYVIDGDEIFGGTANGSIVSTFTVTTTLDVYTQLNSAAVAGATFVADNTTITALRLADTGTVVKKAAGVSADSTDIAWTTMGGTSIVLAAGKYLISYSCSQSLSTLVADAATTFIASSRIYDTTNVQALAGTQFNNFVGYTVTGGEKFGGTASAIIYVTVLSTVTLDMQIKLSAATAAPDTYTASATIMAVKLP